MSVSVRYTILCDVCRVASVESPVYALLGDPKLDAILPRTWSCVNGWVRGNRDICPACIKRLASTSEKKA